MDFTKVTDPGSGEFKIIITIIVVLSIVIIYFVYTKQAKFNKMNPRFVPNGKDAKEKLTIENEKVYKSPSGYEYTVFAWVYVDNITYKYGSWKHILTKGIPNINKSVHAPSIWIHPTHNKLLFNISTNKGTSNLWVDDFPIRKWFSICIVVNNQNCEMFSDGKLTRSIGLKGTPKFNNGDLVINGNGGFAGMVSSINFFSYALTPMEIAIRNRGGPYGSSITENIFNFITRRTARVKAALAKQLVDNIGNVGDNLSKRYVMEKDKQIKHYYYKAPKWFVNTEAFKEEEKYGLKMIHPMMQKKNKSITLQDIIDKYGNNGFFYAKMKKDNYAEKLIKEGKWTESMLYFYVVIENNSDLNRGRNMVNFSKEMDTDLRKWFNIYGWVQKE